MYKTKTTRLFALMAALMFAAASFAAVAAVDDAQPAAAAEPAAEKKTGSDVAAEALIALAQSQANSINTQLTAMRTYTNILSSAATNVFTNPKMYQPVSIAPPMAENKDKLALQYVFPRGVKRDDVIDDVRLAGNCSSMLYEIPDNDSAVVSSYISTNEGLHVVCDKSSATRIVKGFNFDPRKRDWYKRAESTGKLGFSSVFEDARGRGLAVVCSAPVTDGSDKLKGVAGIGAIVSELGESVLELKLGDGGYAFVIDSNGNRIISNDLKKDKKGNTVLVNMLKDKNPGIAAAAKKMVARETGSDRIEIDGKKAFIAYAPVKSVTWSVAVVAFAE